ncbi:FAD-dependent oxidoreductase [Abyssalbus ytuae]|uniref:FAD-dependent oxidoreductase n=1 Tax=Abyssalbus ytuae TaxID=2926907 RepID=A0A9E7D0G7_9FLAO|nr:FAD-dependent oxidoreductase [Abyssalbus ytuae]UOB15998.1 FAD-dependent oxidoreductase [Abyssalbus ytuae]
MFDVLIAGGGAAGMQCALVLGSAHTKEYAGNKKVGIIMHQKASDLQSALFNNVLGLAPGTTGAEILNSGKKQLADLYPQVHQIDNEKVISVKGETGNFTILTNKSEYKSKLIVIAMGYSKFFNIEGLNQFVEPHPKALAGKERIWLKNNDHLIKEGVYVAGTLAGGRSQFAIAAGSGAQVATDILTLWNDGNHTKVHDKIT